MSSASVRASARQPVMPFAWPDPLAAMPLVQRNLTLALGVSLFIHAIILSIHFRLPEAIMRGTENALDVVLVNSKHANKTHEAQVRAQANLDGGGNSDLELRATTPLPPSIDTQAGDDLIASQRRQTQLEAEQKQIMTRLKSTTAMQTGQQKQTPLPPKADPVAPGMDIASRAMMMARYEAQVERNLSEYNKRPRKKFIGLRAEAAVDAQYLDDWRQKVERIGALNYPAAAKGRIYGSVTVFVEIRSSGELERLEIQRPSGSKILDEAALRIVQMGAPYAVFPAEMKSQTDILGFARVLKFTHDDQLLSQ